MKKIFLLLITFSSYRLYAQPVTPTDGEWNKQYVVLKNTAEAEVMIRIGDIDNLGFGWAEGFNPFTGKSTDAHGFPWEINPADAAGTDRIFVSTSYKYGSEAPHDGYTGSTEQPANTPKPVFMPLKDLKDVIITAAAIQLFIDDFQAPDFGTRFQVRINGQRFIEAEKIINKLQQSGPVGKMITIKFAPELLQMLKSDSLVLFIDDPETGMGDGYAIDFVKLLVNPKAVLYKGNIRGKVIDAETRNPIADADAEVKDYGVVKTNAEGDFELTGIPAGLTVVAGSAAGYSSDSKQADVIANETTADILLELKRSGKVTFNNKTLQEGDNLVMNNIRFEMNSSVLLAAGKTELDKLSAFMKENPSVEILLSGHTSSEGSATLNRELSLKRVRSCKDYLVAKGIDEGRITIRGFGPDQPIAPNDTEANRAWNRRVEMKVTKL
jgi:outer membrane protein OmpA-like peptidoglycan-associated protein